MRKSYYLNILFLSFLLMLCTGIRAQSSVNASQARSVFNRTYELVFGPQGSVLHYDVNIIGLYKTSGDICYKGKKMKFNESRYASWNDGVTAYMVDKKKRVVNIYKADSDKKDKYMSKFKFDVNDFEYSWAPGKGGWLLTMKLKHAHFMGIREVKALIDNTTYYPISLRIKVAFFWTTVKISNFRSGNVGDQTFVFPMQLFKGWQINDRRNED